MAMMSGATARATALVGPRADVVWTRDDRRCRRSRQQRGLERDRKTSCALARSTAEPAVAPDNGGKGQRASRGSAFRARAFCAIIAIRRCRRTADRYPDGTAMTSRTRNRCWLVAIGVLLMMSLSGIAPATGVDLSKKGPGRDFARHSDALLAEGTGDCKYFAEHYLTLGAAFRWHENRANVENSFSCSRVGRGWTCKASFIFNDKKVSENDWALFLEFSVDEVGRVSGLNCGAAG